MTETYPSEEDKNRKGGVDCPSCGNSVTARDYQQSKVVCESCGRVLKEEIKDRGPEWRAFTAIEKGIRIHSGAEVPNARDKRS